ncbi:MAG: hypothetical protein A3B38_00500 [Candidatus Levybacteria bacterium RIFCSPLOWO2_01_FULL_36_13]|nr:MAG: hypothetical protein A2684_01740 [Candidatus Levybacteria bacterium RIFCSPHIGHO2_01_FULL_36_15b]OGH35367.1 MAG: hypothetical protein A3B38_00500 [Candidatus Levybacteria bacterium RIFCSPLOWO2_01_FULL_36_13]
MAGRADKGKFIVIEGNDGSGKTTQLELLKSFLTKKQTPVQIFDFPQYQTFHGEFLGRLLNGEFGDLDQINPYLVTFPYALDRLGATPYIKAALDSGKIVLSNRYVTSNLAHQSGRLPKEKRRSFIDWNIELEYYVNGLPREDAVVFLYVPHKNARKLLKKRQRRGLDIAENDQEYLSGAEEGYLYLADRFDHWIKIDCVDEKGKILPKNEIHKRIVLELSSRHLI